MVIKNNPKFDNLDFSGFINITIIQIIKIETVIYPYIFADFVLYQLYSSILLIVDVIFNNLILFIKYFFNSRYCPLCFNEIYNLIFFVVKFNENL